MVVKNGQALQTGRHPITPERPEVEIGTQKISVQQLLNCVLNYLESAAAKWNIVIAKSELQAEDSEDIRERTELSNEPITNVDSNH